MSRRQMEARLAAGRPIRCYAELGIGHGDTARMVASGLPYGAEMHLFDFSERVAAVGGELRAQYPKLKVFQWGNSHKDRDSYCWALAEMLGNPTPPQFDYVYLDGSHDWTIDGFAFMLLDRLMSPGAIIEFDDYRWTHHRSPLYRGNGEAIPQYTRRQRRTRQVAMIVDLLAKPMYREILPGRVYQKPGGGRRRLVYAMQSSGATWITACLAGSHELCIPDLFNNCRAPLAKEFDGQDVIIKATASISRGCSLRSHIRRFQPHELIAVIRDEAAIRKSVSTKTYGPRVDQHLAIFNAALERHNFDRIFDYDECCRLAEAGLFEPLRSPRQLLKFNQKRNVWCRRTSRRRRRTWSTGGWRVVR